MRRFFFVTLVGLCALPTVAAAQDVYISVGPEVRKLTLATKGSNVVVASNTLLYTSGQAFIGDLAVCSDNSLYFVEKTLPKSTVRRLAIGSTSPPGTAETVFVASNVGEIRVSLNSSRDGCDVSYAKVEDEDGKVATLNGKPPFPNTPVQGSDGTGEGLAFAFNGDFVLSPDSTTVNVANGGAGSAPGMKSPVDLPTGARCTSAQDANTVVCTDKTSSSTLSLATFPADDKVQHCEFLTNDTMLCATSVDPDSAITGNRNGALQLITQVGSATRIFTAPRVDQRLLPVGGVAVGASSSAQVPATATQTAAGFARKVDFGPVVFEAFTANNCTMTFQLRQLTLAEAQTKLATASTTSQGVSNAYLLDPGLGGESWLDNVEVTATGNCGQKPRMLISQFNDATPSKAVIHCHGADCRAVTESNFPYSTPDDDGNGGAPDNFSDFMTAAVSAVNRPIVFSTPLQSAPVVVGAIDTELGLAIPTFNATGGLSLRFRICATTDCTTFSAPEQPNPPPNPPPFTGAGLSVTRILLTGGVITGRVNCDVDDNGGANPDRPVYRVAGDTNVFNLNTPLLGDPNACGLADLTSGEKALMAITTFSHSGKFNKTTILVYLQK